MVNINLQGKKEHTYDAIVIGSGMSGGWSAKELADNGLKTLLLERGREVKHNVDYPTTNLQPYELEHRGQVSYDTLNQNPIVHQGDALIHIGMGEGRLKRGMSEWVYVWV